MGNRDDGRMLERIHRIGVTGAFGCALATCSIKTALSGASKSTDRSSKSESNETSFIDRQSSHCF